MPEGSPKPLPSAQSLGSAVSGVPEEGAFKSGEERCSSWLSAATTPHAMTKGQRRCCQRHQDPTAHRRRLVPSSLRPEPFLLLFRLKLFSV